MSNDVDVILKKAYWRERARLAVLTPASAVKVNLSVWDALHIA